MVNRVCDIVTGSAPSAGKRKTHSLLETANRAFALRAEMCYFKFTLL